MVKKRYLYPAAAKRVRLDNEAVERSICVNMTLQPNARATADLSEEKPAACTDEDAEDAIAKAFSARKTHPFPTEIPLQYSFSHSELYTRQCYADYYDHIMNRFQGNVTKGVSVTGKQVSPVLQ